MINFDKIASDVKHLDTRYTWIKDDSGLIHIYKRKDYFSLIHYMTLAFHQNSGVSYVEFLKTVNAFCQTLSDLDYAKIKQQKEEKSARRA